MQDPDAARGLDILHGALPKKAADELLAGVAPSRFQHVTASHGAAAAVLPNVHFMVSGAGALRRGVRARVALLPAARILRVVATRTPPAKVALQYQTPFAARAAIDALLGVARESDASVRFRQMPTTKVLRWKGEHPVELKSFSGIRRETFRFAVGEQGGAGASGLLYWRAGRLLEHVPDDAEYLVLSDAFGLRKLHGFLEEPKGALVSVLVGEPECGTDPVVHGALSFVSRGAHVFQLTSKLSEYFPVPRHQETRTGPSCSLFAATSRNPKRLSVSSTSIVMRGYRIVFGDFRTPIVTPPDRSEKQSCRIVHCRHE